MSDAPTNLAGILIELDEDGYLVASVPALPGCHTQGRTIAELLGRLREAISLYHAKGAAHDHTPS